MRVRISPISGVSRPILAFSENVRTRPPRRDMRQSRPRIVSPLMADHHAELDVEIEVGMCAP